jgi:single-strand DNA-binding protein
MEIFGRATANAVVNTLPDGRSVANFTVVVNETYKDKKSGEFKDVPTYFKCSYWINTKIAQYISKGVILHVSGSVKAEAWVDMKGEAKGELRFHVNTIKVFGGTSKKDEPQTAIISEPANENAPVDDLPF